MRPAIKRQGEDLEKPQLFDLDEFVVACAEADLLAVLDHRAPVGVGMRHVEVIVRAVLGHATGGLELVAHLGELSVGHGGHLEHRVDAGLVDRHGIEAREHTDIGHDGRIVLGMAVAVGADVDGERNVELRAVLDDRLGVLGDLAVEDISRGVAIRLDGILIARADTAATAHAALMVDVRHRGRDRLPVLEHALARAGKAHRAVGANALAGMAAHATARVHAGLARCVLLHLAGTATATHPEILHAATEAGLLMPLEVREADNDVGVHEGMADLGLLHVLAVLDWNERLVRALEAVGDDDLAARGIRSEAVLVRAVDMLERVLAAAHVQRVAVGEKGHAAQLLDHICDGAGIIGTQEGEVAQLAKVDLDGDELVLEVDLLDARTTDETLELVELALAPMRAQAGVVHLGRNGGGGLGGHTTPLSWSTPLRPVWYALKCALTQETSHPLCQAQEMGGLGGACAPQAHASPGGARRAPAMRVATCACAKPERHPPPWQRRRQ